MDFLRTSFSWGNSVSIFFADAQWTKISGTTFLF